MKLTNLGSNKTELTLSNGNIVFFSYNTPVVAYVDNTWLKTSKFWSNTTSKHINQYLESQGRNSKEIPTENQEFFDNLVK
jgi:hypothetical protein